MNEYQEIWNNMLSLLKVELGDSVYNELFTKATKVFKYENNYIYVITPNSLVKFRIEQFFIIKIKELLPQVTSLNVGFKFISESDAKEEQKNRQDNPSKLIEVDKRKPIGRNLSSLFRFENFVTGQSNRYAWLMAMNVAQDGPKVCNPLYIFGDVGLGKTHLMSSIGNYVLDNDINAKVVYTSSQKFAEDYFLATSKGGKEKIEAFYDKYNDVDYLLVDDIQFLEGKTATQEEFFKVFENLVNQNKQIVITSDRPAISLKNIMTRLKSRFSWGVSAEICQPDEELLINILKRKLTFLIDEPNDVGEDVLKILAKSFPNNIRDLEGALRTFINYCICMSCSFTKENLFIALEKLIPDNIEQKDSTKAIIDVSKTILCQYYNVSEQDILSSSRKQQITYARQMLMYILRTKFNIPLQTIGDNLGSRDHATVAHGVTKVTESLKNNTMVKNDYEILSKKIMEYKQ